MKTASSKFSSARLRSLLKNRPILEPRKSGAVEVTQEIIKQGTPITVVSVRNAILMGLKPLSVSLDADLQVDSLVYEGGTWMTTHIQELWQAAVACRNLHGRVLIGGLGLGVIAKMCSRKKIISRTTVVEIDERIVDLVWDQLHLKHGHFCVVADLYDYIKNMPVDQYDSAFFDIWQGTGEFVWREQVVPLRRLCRGKLEANQVYCWQEEEMHGQLRPALCHVCYIAPDNGMPDYYRPLAEVVRQEVHGLPTLHPKNDPASWFVAMVESEIDDRIRYFVEQYLLPGTDEWERMFGRLWDEYVKPYKKEE